MAMEIKHLTTQMHDLSTKAVGVACDAIDEISRLRAENAELKAKNAQLEDDVAFWKKKLEDVQASMYADNVDLGMENRRLKRALWLARAERAHSIILVWNVYCYQNNSLYYRDFLNTKCNPFRDLPKKTAMEWSDLWESIETKLRAKAEEYK